MDAEIDDSRTLLGTGTWRRIEGYGPTLSCDAMIMMMMNNTVYFLNIFLIFKLHIIITGEKEQMHYNL